MRQIILVCFLLLFINVFAQNQPVLSYKRCSVKTLNYEQGLLNNGTTNIISDANGFTWISTFTGIQRYNGYSLEQVTPLINKQIIEINSPVYFFGLQNGNLWISYKQGLLEYSPSRNSFKKIISSIAAEKFPFSIVPLCETNEGVWCMQEKKGIVIYNKKGLIVKKFSQISSERIDSIISSANILFRTVITRNSDFVFILDANNHILQINLNTHQHNNFRLNNSKPFAVTCDKKNLYLISENDLSAANIKEGIILNHLSLTKLIKEKINNETIAIGQNNQLLVGINSHLYEFDTSLIHQKEFTGLSRNLVIASSEIQHIYPDKFKRIWLLTNDDVKRIENVEIPFQHFFYPNEKNNFVRSIYFDEQKHLIIAGCYNGTIDLYDSLANPLWKKPLINTQAGYILAIEKLSDDTYLLHTFRNGLFILNLSKKRIQRYSLKDSLQAILQPNSTNFDNIIQRINDSSFFISTSKNIFKCILKKGKIISAQPLLSAFNPSGEITSFIITSEKQLWAGTTLGVIYKLNEQKVIDIIHIPGNYNIRCFTETANKKVWVGTDKGLYIYDNNGILFKKITRETGLLNDCIYALLPSKTNLVFASTNLGLSYVNGNGIVTNFSKERGLQENEFNTGAAIKTVSGKFYFGGVNGISAFYPANLFSIKDTPVLNITRFVVNDSLINTALDTIVLKYNQNRLQFDFAALGLLNNNEYLYKYRLEGFEENWQTTHHPTEIKYNLTPGKYVLQIECSLAFSSNNPVKKNITIIIHAPWWQTWWFKMSVAIIVIAAISLLVVQYNYKRYIQKIRALESLHQVQTERERISRELHDNIGAQLSFISSNIDWVIDRHGGLIKEKEIQQMKTINATAKNVMMNLRETIWALNKEEITLQEFSDKLKAYIQSILQLQPTLNFETEERIKKNWLFTPTETLNIFRTCQEVINNVIKHAEATVIKLFIYSDESSFQIRIEDNGKGFKLSEKLNEHYGLQNMKYRVQELNAQIVINTEPEKGTSVSITR